MMRRRLEPSAGWPAIAECQADLIMTVDICLDILFRHIANDR